MTKKQLRKLGFKKVTDSNYYWYEFKFREHRFLSNDSWFNDGRDVWFIGYENTKEGEDTFWFNSRLKLPKRFIQVFNILTGLNFYTYRYKPSRKN